MGNIPNVFPNSSRAMKSILDVHFPDGDIVDLNYGWGVFYSLCTNRSVVGLDIRSTGDVACDSRRCPFADKSFSVCVIDPPYKRGRGDNREFGNRYGDAPDTEQKVTRQYLSMIPEGVRLSMSGMIVKCQDGGDGHRFHPRHIQIRDFVLDRYGLELFDFAIISRSAVGNTLKNGFSQRFFRQAVSFFLVYRWTADTRAIRF